MRWNQVNGTPSLRIQSGFPLCHCSATTADPLFSSRYQFLLLVTWGVYSAISITIPEVPEVSGWVATPTLVWRWVMASLCLHCSHKKGLFYQRVWGPCCSFWGLSCTSEQLPEVTHFRSSQPTSSSWSLAGTFLRHGKANRGSCRPHTLQEPTLPPSKLKKRPFFMASEWSWRCHHCLALKGAVSGLLCYFLI